MRVAIDEPGRDYCAFGVDLLACAGDIGANCDNPAVLDANIAAKARRACAIDDHGTSNCQVHAHSPDHTIILPA